MKKKILLSVIASFVLAAATAQPLFTYGDQAVEVDEFLKAFQKHNNTPVTNKAASIRTYLELYIASKLKVREAYARGYDSLPHVMTEVNQLRTQIADNYMTDPAVLDRFVDEAFDRSQKDIRVAHIFIAFQQLNGTTDTASAWQKKDAVEKRLAVGDDFLSVAAQYSDDPAAVNNKGDIGYITVFTLPYEFESVIYQTPIGKSSAVYRSRSGYHFFKPLAERNAAGKIKAQQILLAIPPVSDEDYSKKTAALADSLYRRLLAGDDFGRMATRFSHDYVSAATGGSIPDVGVGQYDPLFENQLRALTKDGSISKPFLTSHGWHIVKRIAVKPVVKNRNDPENREQLKQSVLADRRWKSADDFIYQRIKERGLYTKYDYPEAGLWAIADSQFNFQPMREAGKAFGGTTPLFRIGDSVYTAGNWIDYGRLHRFRDDGSGAKPHTLVLEEYEKLAMRNYYREHLEDFSPAFREQMNEFREGNLFFEIMQREVWDKAQNDSAALHRLYQQQKKKYVWKQSADAVVFFCADQIVATRLHTALQKNPASWKLQTAALQDKVVSDSSKTTWDQLPGLGKATPKAGMLTTPVVNSTDNTASFAYVIRVYHQPTPRSFTEARGMLINDYQALLEKEWDEQLRKKYPVVINQQVLASLTR